MLRKRIRVRTDAVDQLAGTKAYYWYNGSYFNEVTFTAPFGTYYEVIHDTVGGRRKDGVFLDVNPLYHLRADIQMESGWQNFYQSLTIPYDYNQIYSIRFDGRNYRPTTTEASFLALAPYPSSGTLDEFHDGAFASFHEQIPLEVSILNFLWELRSVQDLIPKIERSITKSAASGLLWWKFGVKPLISDLKKLLLVHQVVEERLNFLRSTRGRRVRLGYSRTFDVPTTQPIFLDALGNSGQYVVTTQSCVYRAGGFLTHHLDGLDDAYASWKAHGAALGLNNPAAIVWEAIPYSFVLDWFGRFQELIGKLALQPFSGDYEVKNVTWSLKWDVDYDIFQKSTRSNTNWLVEIPYTKKIGHVKVVRYERNLGIPVPASLITNTELTQSQQLLALALIRQRFR